jgi:hypothetical protein
MSAEKLELKHLAIYLPYGVMLRRSNLKGQFTDWELLPDKISTVINSRPDDNWQPILRPLTDIENEILIDDEFITPYDYLELEKYLKYDTWADLEVWVDYLPHKIVKKLIEWHFDINNLIPKDLAININTLKK